MGCRLTLVPTEFERSQLPRGLAATSPGQACELCGFGPVVAAARTTQLISHYKPDSVTLIGIAGSLTPTLVVGQAYQFSSVRCDGIGVGQADRFKSADQVGFAQWNQSDNSAANPQLPIQTSIGDALPLTTPPPQVPAESEALELLSVCAASADPSEAASRRSRYPSAAAEDMEAFAVAAACALNNVPLTVFRGISNVAGDRDNDNWRVQQAMQSVAKLLGQHFCQNTG